MAPFSLRRKRKPVHRFAAHQIASRTVEDSIEALAAKVDDWQAKVLRYAGMIPEVMTGYLFVHNAMDLVTFEIQRFSRETNEWISDDTPEMQGIERKLNIAFKAGRAAGLMHLVEETFILVRRTDDNGFDIETLSPTEIRSKGTSVEKLVQVGERTTWSQVSPDTTIIRAYTADPVDRTKASGPHKPLIGVLETMALEISRGQAEAISVLAGNGILYIPTEVLPDRADTLDASDTPGSRKAFESALEDSMILTIPDRARGDAWVPLTLYGPAEYADAIRHIVPKGDPEAEAGARMGRLIDRYARSIDLPAQVILGIGDSNHWTDWKVDENTWAYHLRPRAQRIADAMYAGLVKMIVANLGLNTSEYRLVPNASGAIAKTDMSRTALDAYRLGALTPEALIEAIGAEPSDQHPNAEDHLEAVIFGAQDLDGAQSQGMAPPQRTAASSPKSPGAKLRQASKIANAHQRKLNKLFRSYLNRVAKQAARDGRLARKNAAPEFTAAEIPFLSFQPGDYFGRYADELETATRTELLAYLRRISELVGLNYREVRDVWENTYAARALAVRTQAEAAARTIGVRSFDSGKGARVADNVIRTLTSTANGGANDTNGRAGNTARPTHAGDDPSIRSVLQEGGVGFVTQYTWTVGSPDKPYEPHQELEGRTWFSWEEFDRLDVPNAEGWLPGSVFYPGDHDGCQCDYDIEFIPADEATGG